MPFKVILFALIFSTLASASTWKTNKLVNGCRVYNIAGYIERSFPGNMCLFLDNGNLVSASTTAVRMFNPKNEILWEVKGHYHHQMNLSHDQSKILILGSDLYDNLRDDTFSVIDLNGKVLAHRKASDIYREKKLEFLNWRTDPTLVNGVSTVKEISHFNSIYDIPKLKLKNPPAWMKPGNIVVNSTASGIFILSPDLKDILHHVTINASTHHRIHDVQVKDNGNFLIFNNLVANGPATPYYLTGPIRTMHHSAVQEIHPVTQIVIAEFSAQPKTIFYSWICGSVQELDSDTWVFTHFLTGTYIYSKSKKEMVASIPGTHADNQRFGPVQQVKSQDLTKFLTFWP